MKINKILIPVFSLLLVSMSLFSQDRRTLDTRIADLLALFPANDLQYTDKLMGDMLALGEEGLNKICAQVIPAGSGDDTKTRFAIESFSRFLSQKGRETEKVKWEKICITFATRNNTPEVKDFFMKQLQIVGSDQTAEALKRYLSDRENCSSAIAAITATGGESAEHILAESLKSIELPCAAVVINALALMKSDVAVNEYIAWVSDVNVNTKAAAYNALAESASPLAYPVLMKAAKSFQYRWDRTGATASLLKYARNVGEKGDLKTMNKISRILLAKCNDKTNYHYKTAALSTLVSFYGMDIMKDILKAASHPDARFRNAAINMSLSISDEAVVQRWIDFYPKAKPAAKPEILRMLGNRGDVKALSLISESLRSPDPSVRSASAEAIAALDGKKAAPALIEYLSNFDAPSDQEAAVAAMKRIAGNEETDLLKPLLKEGSAAARKSAVDLLAWKKNPVYFKEVFPLTLSSEEQVRAHAIMALQSLAGAEDQVDLIALLKNTDNSTHITDIQAALSSAANKIEDPEKRSSAILKAIDSGAGKEKLIPVLAGTGGREALAVVLREFESGDPGMREICFKALTSWPDYSASSALYEICASGNKTYEAQAFNGYVQQIRGARLIDDQKLLLLRKIMPYAFTPARKNAILTETGKLKTYQALFFTAGYLNDPETSAIAAKSAMTIALPSVTSKAGMYGINVREILTAAMPALKGSESEYDREMINKYLEAMSSDEGFVSMFNGKDLSGWQGLVENPVSRAKMKPAELAKKQAEANQKVPLNWSAREGCIWFSGKGNNLCYIKEYADFEMLVDWKISKEGDSGIYLRGSPQVQIWDTSRIEVGAQVGSGGLYNNKVHPSKPLKVADNPVGDWNTFRIKMVGEKVWVWLNGEIVVDNVTMENYWDRKIPIFPEGAIELQAHGTDLAFRDIYVREISDNEYNLTPEEKAAGFVALFNGRNLDNWVGNKESYVAEDGMIVIKSDKGSGGNLFTEKEYADFILRLEFQLTPGANNGLGIRAPLEGDAAYSGMELQILDNTAPVYANLQPYQYHGSVYGVIPAKRDYLKPVGEWNYQEVIMHGTRIQIILNGTTIVEGDIAGPRDKGTMDQKDHPGLKNKSGHIGFLGHGSVVKFRNIRIQEL